MKVMKNQQGFLDVQTLICVVVIFMIIAALIGAAIGSFATGLPSELTEMKEHCEADLPRDEVCVLIAVPELEEDSCPEAEIFNQAEVLK